MQDLNSICENLGPEYEGRALAARQRAEDIRKNNTRVDGYDEYNRIHIDAPVREALEEAALYDRRAAAARKGRLLIDPADVRWQMENHALISAFAAAYRVDYVGPQASPDVDAIIS
jgi:hypothetical protein